MASTRTAVLGAAVLILAAGCGASEPIPVQAAAGVRLPPAGVLPDYQLGGSYEPEAAVGLVGRDRSEVPAPDTYSICYVNAFQTQPGERAQWPDDLMVQVDGEPLQDPEWPDEFVLDTSSAATRERILTVVQPWIEGCAADGFDAVEFDNLDSYTRSDDRLDIDDNLALAADLAHVAHDAGLAAAQKNAAEHAAALQERAGFDFALVEECAAHDECQDYSAVYGEHVIDIEYTDNLPRSFSELCADENSPTSMVLRDRNLTRPGDEGYVFELCP